MILEMKIMANISIYIKNGTREVKDVRSGSE